VAKNRKRIVKTKAAPKPIGPYSVGVISGRWLFTAGQIGIDPQTGEVVEGGIESETRQALTNIKNILEAGRSTLAEVLKTTVFLRDMADFPQMNQIYAEFFDEDFPARSTVQAAGLPKGAAVEIEALAVISEK
jgi:2-iminobutanoate/2-iminopropanoate deaminase